MRRIPLVVLALTLAACDATGSLGDPAIRVASGADQIQPAAEADSLDLPVTAQLYRLPSGGITFRLVPDLHAQTNVNGIAGEQVCAVPIGADGLAPWNPCNVTGGDGVAQFFFEPGTKAGERCAEIRAVLSGEKVVTDQVCAIVEAGPVTFSFVTSGAVNIPNGEPFFFGPLDFVFSDSFGNNHTYSMAATGALRAVSREVGGSLGYGVTLADGAKVGDPSTITISSVSGSTLRTVNGVIVTSQTPNTWGFALEGCLHCD